MFQRVIDNSNCTPSASIRHHCIALSCAYSRVLYTNTLHPSHPPTPTLALAPPLSAEPRSVSGFDLSSLNFKEQSSYQLYFNLWKEEVKMDLLASRLKIVAQNVFFRSCFHRWKCSGNIDVLYWDSEGVTISASVSMFDTPIIAGHHQEEKEEDEELMRVDEGMQDDTVISSPKEEYEEEEEEEEDDDEEEDEDYCSEQYEEDFTLPLSLPLRTLDQTLCSGSVAPRPSDSKSKRVSFLDNTPLSYEEREEGERDGNRDEDGGRDEERDEGGDTDRDGDEIDVVEDTDNGHTHSLPFNCTHRLTAAEIQVIREEIDGKEVHIPDQTGNISAEENDLVKVDTVSMLGEVIGGKIMGNGEGKGEGSLNAGGEVKGDEKGKIEGEGKKEGEGKIEGEGDQSSPVDEEAEKLKVKAEKKGKREKSERRRSRINRAINCQMSFGNKDIYF
jgi:hypothetical protein